MCVKACCQGALGCHPKLLASPGPPSRFILVLLFFMVLSLSLVQAHLPPLGPGSPTSAWPMLTHLRLSRYALSQEQKMWGNLPMHLRASSKQKPSPWGAIGNTVSKSKTFWLYIHFNIFCQCHIIHIIEHYLVLLVVKQIPECPNYELLCRCPATLAP